MFGVSVKTDSHVGNDKYEDFTLIADIRLSILGNKGAGNNRESY